jgi:hypothetical protein
MGKTFSEKQEESLHFFREKLDSLADDPAYKMKYVVVYNSEIVEVSDTFGNALIEAVAKYPQNEFIIQQVIRESDIVSFLYPAVS